MANQDQSNPRGNTDPNRSSIGRAQREGNLGNERNRETDENDRTSGERLRNRSDEGERGRSERSSQDEMPE